MPEKYLYNGKLLQRNEVEQAARQSKMDINTYIQKAGMKVVNDNYNYNGKTLSAEAVLDGAKQSNMGFDDYLQKAGINPLQDIPKKKVFSDGSQESNSNGQSTLNQNKSIFSDPIISFEKEPEKQLLPQPITKQNIPQILSFKRRGKLPEDVKQSGGIAVVKTPEQLFSGADKGTLDQLADKYKVSTEFFPYDKFYQETGVSPIDKEENVSVRPFVNEYKVASQIQSDLQQQLNETRNAIRLGGDQGAYGGKSINNTNNIETEKALVADLKAAEILKKKAWTELTIEGDKEVSANIRTNQSGNELKRFLNRLATISPSTSTIGAINLSTETEDRIKKLPSQFITGLNYYDGIEPVIFERISDALIKGLPISETQIANITQQGIEIEQARLDRQLQKKGIEPQQYNEKVNELNIVRKDNVLNNKEVLGALLSDGAANILDEIGKKKQSMQPGTEVAGYLFGHTWNYDDAQIKGAVELYAQKIGLDPQDARIQDRIKYLQDNEGAMFMENSIAKAGGIREFFKGVSEPIRGISNSVEDLVKSSNDVYAESQSQGNVNVSDKRLKLEDVGIRGIINDVVKGSGQFATQAALAYLTSGAIGAGSKAILGRAGTAALQGDIALADMTATNIIGKTLLNNKDAFATFVTSAAQSYDPSLKSALSYTSDNELAKKAATVNALTEASTELFLSPLSIAKGIASKFKVKGVTEDLVKVLDDKNLLSNPTKLKNVLTKSLNGLIGTAKVAGAEISEEMVTQIADYVTNAYLNPDSQSFQNRDLQNELAVTAYQTGLSMALPALLNGVGAANANTFSKGSLLIAAQNRQKLIDGLTDDLSLNNIDQQEYNKKVSIINTAAQANAELPLKANGEKLNTDQKADYIFSRVSEEVMQNKINESKDEAEKRVFEKKIKEQQDFRTALLESGQPVENQVQENITTEKTNQPEKIFTDFDGTVFKDGKLTQLGEQLKQKALAGEDVTVLTAREATPENIKFIAETLGINEDKIKAGLDADSKASLLIPGSTFYNENDTELNAAKKVDGVNVIDVKSLETGSNIDNVAIPVDSGVIEEPGTKLSETVEGLDEQGVPIQSSVVVEPPTNIPEPIPLTNEKSSEIIVEQPATPEDSTEPIGTSNIEISENIPTDKKEDIPNEDKIIIEDELNSIPPDNDEGTGIYTEDKRTILSHRGLQEIATEFDMEDIRPRERIRDLTALKNATETIDTWVANNEYDSNIKSLVIDAEQTKALNRQQQLILQQHISNVRSSAEIIRKEKGIGSTEYDRVYSYLNRLVRAGEVARSTSGDALRVPNILSIGEPTVEKWMIEETELNKNAPLTKNQKEVVEKEFEEISSVEKAYKDKVADLENQQTNKESEEVVKKIKSTAKKTKKTHDDYVQERKKIEESISEKLKKARGELSVTPIPYAKELFAIAPDVAKLLKSYVEEGVSKLADIVTAIQQELKAYIPNITEQDVNDIIAGNYNAKRKTKNELTSNIVSLRQQAKLVNKLSNLVNGIEPVTESKKIKRNQEIESLQQQIKDFIDEKEDASNKINEAKKEEENLIREFEKEFNKTEKDKIKAAVNKQKELIRELEKKTPEEIALQSLKTKISNDIKKLESDLSTGNFDEPIKKEPIKLDAEAIELKDRMIKLKMDRQLRIIKQQQQNLSATDKLIKGVSEVLNIPRALMSTLDYSAVLRQGIVQVISHPSLVFNVGLKDGKIKLGGAGVNMIKAGVSQKMYDRWFFDLKESPRYNLMEKSGLGITDSTNPLLSVREEGFMSSLAEKIPLVGETLSIGNVKIPGTNLIKGSERSYSMFLNKLRVDVFNRFADAMEERGLTFENSPEQYKQMADYVNNSTGRGNVGVKLNKIAPLLNALFFSPRLIASRLNMLTYLAQPRFYKTVPKEVREAYFKDMTKFIGTGMLVLALFSLGGGGGDDKDKITVETDPRSSDFGKIKQGNTRWDIWGGFQQYVRVAAQAISGQSKSSTKNKIYELDGEGPFGRTRGDVLVNFARGKLAPVPAMAIDLFSGKTPSGDKVVMNFGGKEGDREITIDRYLKEHLIPLTFTGTQEAIKDKGIKALFTVGIPSIFGVGTQVYKK